MEVQVDEFGNPHIGQFSEDGFVDCVFRVKSLIETSDSYSFQLWASHQGDLLSFAATVVKGIKGGFDSEMQLIKDHVYHNGVKFFRTGSESDSLISILSTLYGNEPKKIKMVQEATFTGIALHQDPIDMRYDAVKIKIFGKDSEPLNEDDYYESFFNLDLKNGFVFWNEKDPDYRAPLIRGLSE